MATCPSCASEVPDHSRFCLSCGTAIETPTSAPTETSLKSQPSPASHPKPDQARFIPGTMLAKRYRIVGLLGRGGMGEVYRADDLKLGQPVALKFLPQAVQRDQTRLDRFLNEVKTALKVTHPNVCRVYDIGEVEGQHYLSMEYVDGEDLSSLLRRIERLPQNKAVQIARQLCAGLAAAHDQGILHRDLKPANVMIDGRGRAKITDFGLAGLAEGIEGDEVRAGTPQYMSPEQHASKEVTILSDIYSLGLVLYELFTGKRAFEGKTPAEIAKLQEQSTPTSPSSHVEGLDETVERIILRCLETDPGQRPATALAVAAALPGGDPLAAALAAGETPTPGMVADAGGVGSLRPAVAFACAAVILISMAAGIFVCAKYPVLKGIAGRITLEKRPEVLAEDAREILQALGHTDQAVDHDFGFKLHWALLFYIEQNDDSPDRWDRISSEYPPAVYFWYRQSPRPLMPTGWFNERVNQNDPEMLYSGEVNMDLYPNGRLRWLEIVPPQIDESEGPFPEPEWSLLFAAAGLDMDRFEPVEPVWVPDHYCDNRAAWEGSYPGESGLPVRIEAGAYRGKPVYFKFIDSFTPRWRMVKYEAGLGMRLWVAFGISACLAMMIAAVLLARRNLKLGRGDRRGATRLAVFVMIAFALRWLLWADHSLAIKEEFSLLTQTIAICMFAGGLTWLVYIALEPFLRRRWPKTLVSWNRLLMGRFRDPLIGRDLVAGVTACYGWGLLIGWPVQVIPVWLNILPPMPEWYGPIENLLGGRYVAGTIIRDMLYPIFMTMGLLFFLACLSVVLRKQWLAFVAFVLITSVPSVLLVEPPWLFFILGAQLSLWTLALLLLSRFGFLSVCAFWASAFLGMSTSSAPDWYVPTAVVFTLVILALAGYGLIISLGGRPILGEAVLPED